MQPTVTDVSGLSVLDPTMSCAKTDEPIEMPLGCGLGCARGTTY